MSGCKYPRFAWKVRGCDLCHIGWRLRVCSIPARYELLCYTSISHSVKISYKDSSSICQEIIFLQTLVHSSSYINLHHKVWTSKCLLPFWFWNVSCEHGPAGPSLPIVDGTGFPSLGPSGSQSMTQYLRSIFKPPNKSSINTAQNSLTNHNKLYTLSTSYTHFYLFLTQTLMGSWETATVVAEAPGGSWRVREKADVAERCDKHCSWCHMKKKQTLKKMAGKDLKSQACNDISNVFFFFFFSWRSL